MLLSLNLTYFTLSGQSFNCNFCLSINDSIKQINDYIKKKKQKKQSKK